MSFTRKYLLWLLAPPIVISVLPSLLFLSQVVQFSTSRALGLFAFLALTYVIGCVIFTIGVRPYAKAVEDALEGHGDLSMAMSACLDRTKTLSLVLWAGGGLLFALIGAVLLLILYRRIFQHRGITGPGARRL